MKRILALLLCLIMLLPLASCAAESTETATVDAVVTEEKKEEKTEEKKEETKTEESSEVSTENGTEDGILVEEPITSPKSVNEPLTWDRLNQIPIANSSMSIDQLRQICVDFFALQVTFTWTPKETVSYEVDSQKHKVKYQKGGLYAGIPYVNLGSNNLYRVLDNYDSETGTWNGALLETKEKLAGNACSSSAGLAWGRVINSASLSYTSGHTPKAGFLPLGDYKTNFDIPTFGGENPDVKDIIALNDKETMYKAFALLKPADGIVSGGHVRMAKEAAHVVYNPDGTINPEESYCIFVEQGCYCSSAAHTRVQADGTSYQIQGNDNYKATFSELVKSYIPFTFAEWQGTNPVEKSEITMSKTGANLTLSELLRVEVTSNYIITDAYCSIKDASGTEVFSYAFRQPKHYLKSFDLSGVIPTSYAQKYAKEGGYTIEFSAQLSTGERPVFYTGNLVG